MTAPDCPFCGWPIGRASPVVCPDHNLTWSPAPPALEALPDAAAPNVHAPVEELPLAGGGWADLEASASAIATADPTPIPQPTSEEYAAGYGDGFRQGLERAVDAYNTGLPGFIAAKVAEVGGTLVVPLADGRELRLEVITPAPHSPASVPQGRIDGAPA